MANGFDSSKITRQLRSPRNLLEFADISIQPRQSTTAEVIANTLDDAFERASQTYLQGKQLDAQVQQQQIQSDLRKEQLNIQQKQFQVNQDRATDNVLMESLKDINLKTEAGRTEAKATLGEVSDARLARILGSRLDASINSSDRLSKYEEQFQGKDISEILTGTFSVGGEEKSGRQLLDEYMAINPTGSGIFGVSKDKMLMDMTAKYRGSAEYFDFAYGQYTNEKGESVDKLDRLGFTDKEKQSFRSLLPSDGSKVLAEKLLNKGVTQQQAGMLRNLEGTIRNRKEQIAVKLSQINSKATSNQTVVRLKDEILNLEKEIKGYDADVDSLYRSMGLAKNTFTTKTKSKSEVVSNNMNSFINLNSTEKQSFLQNHPQLKEIQTIVNNYTSQNKNLDLKNPEFLDSLSKIGVFNDTIKTKKSFPSVGSDPVVDSGTVETTTVESPLPNVPRPNIPIPPTSLNIEGDVDEGDTSFNVFEDIPDSVEPAVITPKKIEDHPSDYTANNPLTASGTVSKDINKLFKQTERLQKFRDEGQPQVVINNQNKKIKELQNKIKSKFFGYISSETGNFSNQNYTDKFYNSLSSKTKQSPQRLKTLMQIITSSR